MSPSSFLFLQACGTLLQDFDGVPYDGETQQDVKGFLDQLLGQLRQEEDETAKANRKQDSLLQEKLGIQAKDKVRTDRYANFDASANAPGV